MMAINKIKRFIFLNTSTKLLLLEAYFYLGWARILKLLPFSKVSVSLGDHMLETPYCISKNNIRIVKEISSALHIMSRYTLWESQCLVKAIAGMKMLERRNIESTLYLGTARDKQEKLIAHAWLRSGSIIVSGSEGMERFTEVGKFAKRMGG